MGRQRTFRYGLRVEPNARVPTVRLFLVGLNESIARSLARYCSGDPDMEIIGAAPSLALAGILIPAVRPDLALLDWPLVAVSGRDALKVLRAERPGLRLICVASEAAPYGEAARLVGADALISSDEFAQELKALLRQFFPRSPPISQ